MTLEEVFCGLVNNPLVHCEIRRGLWHVPDYQGVRMATGSVHSQGFEVARRAAIGSPGQLQDLLRGGQQQTSQVLDGYTAQNNARVSPVFDQLQQPQISASAGDQPPLPQVRDNVLQQIQAEAIKSLRY